ncbi:MAG: ATP-dependent helicase, partial [Deltaproteobacteria bacterium]
MSKRIDYDKVLNAAQLQAVTCLEGPLLVIAGAGSGKTRTLVYRVARLVESGVPPESILLLTFTRKASGEMLERAAGLADERCRFVSGGTFHSLAHRVLRRYATLLGFENTFTVLDRSDMEEAIQSLLQEMHLDKGAGRFPKRATLANILSKAANLECSVESLMEEEYSQFLEHTAQIKKLKSAYKAYKRENQLMDYDDLIVLFRQILAEHEEIRTLLSGQYRYVMVDEYQDTNAIQADIVKWLAFGHRNVMVVGDDAQSIYSFRGANYKNMFEFPQLFPDTRIIRLEQNYRSTQPILNLTNALMEQAKEKYTKCLFTERQGGARPTVVDARTEPEQAMYVCRAIKEQLHRGRPLKDVAVLFRAAYHSFELEVELARQGIPFVKYGGFKFMESAHIKDLLAHLRVVTNRDDSVSWGRILRLIKNIGQGKSQAIVSWMRENRVAATQVHEWPGAAKKENGLRRLADLLVQLAAKDLKPERAIGLAVEYYEPILMEKFDDLPRRKKDLEQLLPMAGRYQKLRSFLDDLALEPPGSVADMSSGQRGECLTLSTVHSAKGLEWSAVFIIWATEGYFPSARSSQNEESLEEERRLMYVAATRAKDHLTLCYPGQETGNSWSSGYNGFGRGLSSFIQALPQGLFEFRSMGAAERVRWPSIADPAPHAVKEPLLETAAELKSGDRVKHPAFGHGVISKLVDKEKVEVLFRDVGRKLLHLGYTSLEK